MVHGVDSHSFSFSRVFGAHLDPIPPKGSLESAQTSTTFEWRKAAIGQEGTMVEVERRKAWKSLATIFDRLVSEFHHCFFGRGLIIIQKEFHHFSKWWKQRLPGEMYFCNSSHTS